MSERVPYVVANAIGLALYAYLVERILRSISAEGRDYAEFGDGLRYLVTALPVLAFFTLFNVTWFVWTLKNSDTKRVDALFTAAMLLVWVTEFVVLRYL